MEKDNKFKPQIDLGKRIKLRRKELKLSQSELADRSSLHKNYISDVERGTRNISIQAMTRIADGLEISLHKLFVYGKIEEDK